MYENLDAVSPGSIIAHSSPSECLGWPADVKINSLAWRPERNEFKVGTEIGGLHFEFSPRRLWPDYTPPGWTKGGEGLQYTVWAGFLINGKWHAAGFVQMWRTRYQTGAPILQYFPIHWAYDQRWGELYKYQPKVGEEMILFLTAGNARSGSAEAGPITDHNGRSNIIKVKVPANDYGDFNFTYSETPNAPVPVPVPDVPVSVPNVPSGTLDNSTTEYILASLMEIRKSLDELKEKKYIGAQEGTVDFLGPRKFKITTVLTPKD